MKTLEKLGSFLPGSRIGALLVHGLTGTPIELNSIARDLNNFGFSVLCPVLAGHCYSEAELLKTSWPDWYASVASACEEFSKHMDVIFVGGISAGAVLSLRLAQLRPELVRGLALYSTTLWWDGWSIPKLSFLLPLVLRLPIIGKRYRFEENYPYGLKNEKLRNRVHAQMMRGDSMSAGFSGTPGHSLRELWRMVDLVKAGLKTIKSPALILHAKDDDIASIRNALYLKNHLGGPTCLVPLESSYHMITIDQERKKVALETARFWNEQLNEEETLKLTASAQNEKSIKTLLEAEPPREWTSSELLKGLSKRRHWV